MASLGSTVFLPVGLAYSGTELRWADKGLADVRNYTLDASEFLIDSGLDSIVPGSVTISSSPAGTAALNFGALTLTSAGAMTWPISGGVLTNPIADYMVTVTFDTVLGQSINTNIWLRVWPQSPNKTFSTDLIVIQGNQGPPGPGRSITSVAESTAGTMTVTFSDGSTTEIALPPGEDGRGISSIAQPAGNSTAVVTFTDGTSATLFLPNGPPGNPGVGITSITQPSGNTSAVIALTSGATQQISLPAGPQGNPGADAIVGTPKGLYNVATNTPTLSNGGGGGVAGDTYTISVAGTMAIDGVGALAVGNRIQNTGTAWVPILTPQGAQTFSAVGLGTATLTYTPDLTRPFPMYAASWEDGTGNQAGAIKSDGTLLWSSASIISLAVTGTLTASLLAVGGSNINAVQQLRSPSLNYVYAWEDGTGNQAGAIKSDGTLLWSTASITTLNVTGALNITSFAPSSVVVGGANINAIQQLRSPSLNYVYAWEDGNQNQAGAIRSDGTLLWGTASIINLTITGSFSVSNFSPSSVAIGGETTAAAGVLLPNIASATADPSGNLGAILDVSGRNHAFKSDPCYAAHNKARRSMMATVSVPLSVGGLTGTNVAVPATTLRSIWSLEDDFDYVRLVFFNDRATNWSIVSAAVANTSALGNYVSPTGATGPLPGGWVPVTFNNGGANLPYTAQNSGSVTSVSNMGTACPPPGGFLGADTNGYNLYCSDWIACRSLPRSDGGIFPLLNVSVTVVGTSGQNARAVPLVTAPPCLGGGTGAYGDGGMDVIGGRKFQCYSATGDYTSSNLTSYPPPAYGSTPPGYIQPCLVQVILRSGRTVTLMSIGDSTEAGYGGFQNYGYVQRMTLGLSKPAGTGLPIHYVGLSAWPGATAQDYLANAKVMLPIVQPQILLLQTWTVNSARYLWAANTFAPLGLLVEDTNGNWQQAGTTLSSGLPGTTGSSVPPWSTTLNGTTVDGTVLWTCITIGQYFSQPEADFCLRGAMDLAYMAEAWGCVPIFVAPIPNLKTANNNGYAEPFRLSIRTRVLQAGAAGAVTLDFEAALGQATPTNPMNPNPMIPALCFQNGGVHPNDYGYSVEAQIAIPKMLGILDLAR